MKSRHLRLLFLFGRLLSPFYSGVMRLRAWLYRRGWLPSEKMSVPVISIGNLTLGGTGKTPMVIYVVGLLQKMGRGPAVISRGYGGKGASALAEIPREALPGPNGPLVVSDGERVLLDATLAGDEPVLLARSLPGVPVLVSPRRVLSARYATEKMKIDCLVLDDGFQHLALGRDIDLALFSAHDLPGSFAPAPSAGGAGLSAEEGRGVSAVQTKPAAVFPGGPLREPWSALSRAHGVVITGVSSENQAEVDAFCRFLADKFPALPVFAGEYLPVCLLAASKGKPNSKIVSLDQARDRPLYAFAGIARPESFRETLQRQGFLLTGYHSFPDHHPYTGEDYKNLVAAAKSRGAGALITTEKDLVKLGPMLDDYPLYALRVALFMEKAFDDFIRERITQR